MRSGFMSMWESCKMYIQTHGSPHVLLSMLEHAKRPAVWGFQSSVLSDDYASMDVSIPAGTREALEHALAAPAVQHPADPLSDELLTPAERRELAAAGVSPSLLFHKTSNLRQGSRAHCT